MLVSDAIFLPVSIVRPEISIKLMSDATNYPGVYQTRRLAFK